jgi:uncharacterized membrane protein YjfL (UPF0719 family)
MPWERWGVAAAIFAEILILLAIGRAAAQALARGSLTRELSEKDNAAVALAVAGYYLGLFIALSGLLEGPPMALIDEMKLVALHGLLGIACALLSAGLWRPILGVNFRTHLFESRNTAAGLVCAAGLTATGLIYRGSVQGEGGFGTALVFFALGQGALFAVTLLYEWITPYDVRGEVIDRGNVSAAAAFAGVILASGLIVGHAATGDFTTWRESLKGFSLLLIPLAAMPLIRWLVAGGLLFGFRSLSTEITRDRNLAAGVIEAVAYVGSAILVTRLV